MHVLAGARWRITCRAACLLMIKTLLCWTKKKSVTFVMSRTQGARVIIKTWRPGHWKEATSSRGMYRTSFPVLAATSTPIQDSQHDRPRHLEEKAFVARRCGALPSSERTSLPADP